MDEKGNSKEDPNVEMCKVCGKQRKLINADSNEDLLDNVHICHRCGKAYTGEDERP